MTPLAISLAQERLWPVLQTALGFRVAERVRYKLAVMLYGDANVCLEDKQSTEITLRRCLHLAVFRLLPVRDG